MKPAPWEHLEQFRVPQHRWGGPRGSAYGAFQVPYRPHGIVLRIIASSTSMNTPEQLPPWEHVSISTPNRCPNWTEMCFAKDLFWDEEEAVMQLHPPRSQYVNNHPYCLHLWRPTLVEIPMPPTGMVGVPGLTDQEEVKRIAREVRRTGELPEYLKI